MFYSLQVPLRRKVHICCMFTVGGAAVLLGFVRMHSLRITNTGENTSRAVGEAMIVGALGMSMASIAHNLPSMRVFYTHVSSSRSKPRNASQRPCGVKTHNVIQRTITYSVDSVDHGTDSFSRPMLSVACAPSWAGRPLPALPEGGSQLRYPLVDEEFGSRPRTPPSVA